MNKDDYCPICEHDFCICNYGKKHKRVNFIYKEKGPHIGKWISKTTIESPELKEPSPYDGDYRENNELPWEE